MPADAVVLTDDQRVWIYRTALTARRFEELVTRLGLSGEIPNTLHLGAGQEVCQTAALAALRPDDPMLYGHRGTAYWIARGLSLGTILCDIACREGGTNRGRGGAMHIFDPALGILGESGTLGANFTIGAGVAFADKHRGRDSVTVLFFGDGTANRGQFHEAANFAASARLPVIFFCENNGFGLSVPVTAATSVPDIAARAVGYDMPGVVVDGRDAAAVYSATAEAAIRARAGDGPTLIEAKVDRIGGHWLGDRERYRSDEDRRAAVDRDPLPALEADLRARGLIDDSSIAAIEAAISDELHAAVSAMRAQPLADTRAALEGLFVS